MVNVSKYTYHTWILWVYEKSLKINMGSPKKNAISKGTSSEPTSIFWFQNSKTLFFQGVYFLKSVLIMVNCPHLVGWVWCFWKAKGPRARNFSAYFFHHLNMTHFFLQIHQTHETSSKQMMFVILPSEVGSHVKLWRPATKLNRFQSQAHHDLGMFLLD